jgi:hypothetical protein
VIAPPPGRGIRSQRQSWADVAAFVAGTIAASLALTIPVVSIWRLGAIPLIAAAITVLLALVAEAFGSRWTRGWRVPQGWARVGHVKYAAVFGAAVGIGFATALPSFGVLAVLAWGASAPGVLPLIFAFTAFGIGRAAPVVLAALRSQVHGGPAFSVATVGTARSNVLVGVEAALLGGLAVLLL